MSFNVRQKIADFIGGLSPAGDISNLITNTKNLAENKGSSYVGLGASVIGTVPIAGDVAK